jgi:hypothetical protein
MDEGESCCILRNKQSEHILLKLYDSQISVIELEENATDSMDSFAMYPFREANEYKG